MKVALVCPRSAGGVVGGFERLWTSLADSINTLTDHEATLIGVTSPESNFAEVIVSYAKFSRLRFDEYDVVVTGKYPAWMIHHRCHVIYMAHTLRGLYDAYPDHVPRLARPESVEGRQLVEAVRTLAVGFDQSRRTVLALAEDLASKVSPNHSDHSFPGPLAREVVRWFDADALHPRRIMKYAAISSTVARREGYFPVGADVDVIVPPAGLDGLRGGPHRSIFTASRLDGPKRIDLIVDAMKHVTVPCSLRIAGTGPAESELRERARHDDRIEFLGLVDDHQLVDEYANALVVPFVPRDEDLGLITIEAHMSAKPVITCTDSGGAAEMVSHGVDGFVVEPTPEALGAALSTLVLDPGLAARMGEQGRQKAQELTYPRVIDRLLDIRSRSNEQDQRQRVVVFSTYEAEPARHGGQVRVSRLLRELARRIDVLYIAVTDSPSARSCSIAPGLQQTVVRPSPRSKEIEGFLACATGVPVTDVAALLSADSSAELKQLAAIEAQSASAIVLIHPYLFPLIRDLDPTVPVVYDSQNAEWALKRAMYPDDPSGRALATAVAEAEAATMRRAALITAVSDADAHTLQSLTSTLANFVVVPNGVDADAIEFVTGTDRRIRRNRWLSSLRRSGCDSGVTDVAVFVGSAHPPNIEAAAAVLAAAAQMPNVLFVLAGSHADALGGLPRGDNVIARGVVGHDEMQVLLSMCTVALNPMRGGSGTNIKMLDYFAAGAPTISTAIGARGLGSEHDVHLLLAENTDELVRAIAMICEDVDCGHRLATSALSLAQLNNWRDLGRRYAEHVISLVGRF